MSEQRVLLWVTLDSHFCEMFRVALLLKSQTSVVPVILFHFQYPRFAEDIARCVSEGIAFEDLSPKPSPEEPVEYTPFQRKVRKWFLVDFITSLLVVRRIVQYKNLLRHTESIFDRHQPVLLILPEDNVEYSIPAYINIARKRGIPSIVICYTIANAREPAEAYWEDPNHWIRGFWCKLTVYLFPRWVHEHKGRRLLRLTADHIVAQHWHRLAPPLPWINSSGYANVIAVESEAIRDYYLRAGLPEKQLRVLGALRQDEMAHYRNNALAQRRQLLESIGLQDDRLLIVCALPPNQHPEARPDCEFKSYQDVLQFWAETLGSMTNCHVVANPHPRTPLKDVSHLENWGIHVVREDIARLIPLCDIYVASASATICMALACGKPVVNYDVYRFRYDDFNDVPRVKTVDNRTDFIQSLALAAAGIDKNSSLSNNQDSHSRYWGLLDGKATERLIDVIDKLVPKKDDKLTSGIWFKREQVSTVVSN